MQVVARFDTTAYKELARKTELTHTLSHSSDDMTRDLNALLMAVDLCKIVIDMAAG